MGGAGSIPHSAILASIDRWGMEENEAEWFASLVEAMDNAFLGYRAETTSDQSGALKIKIDDVDGIKRLLRSHAKQPAQTEETETDAA